jgi:hypothetical protein
MKENRKETIARKDQRQEFDSSFQADIIKAIWKNIKRSNLVVAKF